MKEPIKFILLSLLVFQAGCGYHSNPRKLDMSLHQFHFDSDFQYWTTVIKRADFGANFTPKDEAFYLQISVDAPSREGAEKMYSKFLHTNPNFKEVVVEELIYLIDRYDESYVDKFDDAHSMYLRIRSPNTWSVILNGEHGWLVAFTNGQVSESQLIM